MDSVIGTFNQIFYGWKQSIPLDPELQQMTLDAAEKARLLALDTAEAARLAAEKAAEAVRLTAEKAAEAAILAAEKAAQLALLVGTTVKTNVMDGIKGAIFIGGLSVVGIVLVNQSKFNWAGIEDRPAKRMKK